MRPLAALCLLLAAGCVSASCPPGMYRFWGFNAYQDLAYVNRGRTYFTAAAHRRCPSFPVYMHDMLNFGARFTDLCANDGDDLQYTFSAKDPCRGGRMLNGTMYLGRLPRRCAVPEITGKSWDQMQGQTWLNAADMPAVKCPAGYRPATARDAPALRAVLNHYFTTVSKGGVQLDRYNTQLYCHDAFSVLKYNWIRGCVARGASEKTAVIAQAVVEFACYGRGGTKRIGLRTPGSYFMSCPRTVEFKW